ncbi:MAG: hypothetical protein H6550_12120 [Chitinophagales bacterium]|nr:hypothetical protein [Chitinophagales bacterium]
MTKPRKYGSKGSIFSIAQLVLFLAVIALMGSIPFLLIAGGLFYSFVASILSVIYIKDEQLYVHSFLIPFSKKHVFPLAQIKCVNINPSTFIGKTGYTFKFKDGLSFATYNKLLSSERKALVKELRQYGIEVHVTTFYDF